MNISRGAIGLAIGVILCIFVVTPFVVAIKYLDNGVFFILASPVLVWLLLWVGKKLERWVRNEPDTPPPDPDYPDDS